MTTTLATRANDKDLISPPDSGQNKQLFNLKALKKLKAEYRKEIQSVADALNKSPELRMAAKHAFLANAVTASAVMKSSKTPLRPFDPAMLKVKGGKVSKNPGSRKGGNKFWQFLCKLYSREEKKGKKPQEKRGRGDFHRTIKETLDDLSGKHRLKKMYIESDDFLEMDKDKQHKFVKEHMESASFTERSKAMQAEFIKSVQKVLGTAVEDDPEDDA